MKNKNEVMIADKPMPARYLFALNALLYKACIGFNTELIAVLI
jgi:hypothetical protein